MRIRSIKPEVHLDEALWDLEQETGLPVFRAFSGLWAAADREGRFQWRPRALKASILPYWNQDFTIVLDALVSGDFLVKYEVDGEWFGLVRTFLKHQVINIRESKSELPEPPQTDATCTHVQTHDASNPVYTGINPTEPVRQTVLARDGYKCVRCGSTDHPSVDHIFPRSMGGTHALTNLRTLCRSCNSARPVQGEALIADLAKDGLTLADMSRMCMHVQARVEGKGREQEGKGAGEARAGSVDDDLPGERPSLRAVVDRDEAISGKVWFREAMGADHFDLDSWRSEFAKMWRAPAPERLAVARSLAADSWVQGNRKKAHPGHVVKFWAEYVDGPRNLGERAAPKPRSTVGEVSPANEHAADGTGGF